MGHEKMLSARALKFLDAYCRTLSAVESAKACGMGKTRESQRVSGSKFLKRPIIKQMIEERLGRSLNEAIISRDRMLQELADIGTADLTACLNDDGTPKPLSEWGRKERAAASEISCTRTESEKGSSFHTKVKLAGKRDALELAAKLKGLLKETNSGPVFNAPVLFAGIGQSDLDALHARIPQPIIIEATNGPEIKVD